MEEKMAKIKKIKSPLGTKEMKVHETYSGADKHGHLEELQLIDETGTPLKIVGIPDGTIIETEASPGCRWYFFGRSWIRICD